jgi:hypothetical protein
MDNRKSMNDGLTIRRFPRRFFTAHVSSTKGKYTVGALKTLTKDEYASECATLAAKTTVRSGNRLYEQVINKELTHLSKQTLQRCVTFFLRTNRVDNDLLHRLYRATSEKLGRYRLEKTKKAAIIDYATRALESLARRTPRD